MSRRTIGLLLGVGGVVLVNFAYLHDVIWQTHGGFIVMGLKSYAIALAGTVAVLAGALLRLGQR